MRVKILEALARGLPVVSTTVGYEGIDAVPGVHLLAADDAPVFARQVKRVFDHDDLADSLARAGRTLALERYDATAIGDRLRGILAEFEAGLTSERR